MKVLSLFSGIGGFDLGFERAGMEVVGMCEIDRHAQAVLQRHFPHATLHTDVRSIQYGRGAVDVICGGFPCQDLSVAGKRRGLDGERSGLWFEFARIIDEVEPKWVVIENVPGLFSSAGGRDFAVIIQWLAQRGYGVGWRVLDSQGFGLAQRRKRVFIVGSFGTPHGCTLLLEPESVRWDSTSSRRSGQGDTGAVAKYLTTDVSNTLTRQNTGDATRVSAIMIPFAIQGNIVDRQHGGAQGFGISQSNISYTLTAMDRHAVAHQLISPTLRAEAKQSLMTGDGNINAPLAIALNGQHGQWSALNEQSHTLSTTRIEQVCIPIGVRRLTPTECERLQGFPDGWTAGQADSHRYKQLGNAVSVPVAQWIGRRIMEVTP